LTGFGTVLSLAAASWLIRLTFIVFVPPHRLPRRFTAGLGHVAPAVLAALVSVGALGAMRGGSATTAVAVLGCAAAIAIVASRRPSLTITAVLGVISVVLLDLVLAR
jgi:branched-subunit amino acid transport protein